MVDFEAGALILAHLRDPTEKFWGVLVRLDSVGLTFRGLNVSTFDDWMAQAVHGDEASIGLATMFVPIGRVERIFLDEQVGVVASYAQRFRQRVGMSVFEYLEPRGRCSSEEAPS